MSLDKDKNPSADTHQEADFAQAFKELTKGEQTASALEKHLSAMEKKIDALLAQAEQDQKDVKQTLGDSSLKGGEDKQK